MLDFTIRTGQSNRVIATIISKRVRIGYNLSGDWNYTGNTKYEKEEVCYLQCSFTHHKYEYNVLRNYVNLVILLKSDNNSLFTK
jgi:hypothetical protein